MHVLCTLHLVECKYNLVQYTMCLMDEQKKYSFYFDKSYIPLNLYPVWRDKYITILTGKQLY